MNKIALTNSNQIVLLETQTTIMRILIFHATNRKDNLMLMSNLLRRELMRACSKERRDYNSHHKISSRLRLSRNWLPYFVNRSNMMKTSGT